MKRLLFSLAVLAITTVSAQRAEAGIVGFDIQLVHNNTPSAAEQTAFDSAEATWESLISGYQENVASTILTITTTLAPIDGSGGILGSAGPGDLEGVGNFAYARTGTMTFDTADTADLDTSGILDDVILHEMGHVLGIGTLWSIGGFQQLYATDSGEYTGVNALAAWQTEFNQPGATFVPVELGGDSGTANGHWNEVDGGGGNTGIVSNITGLDFKNELMTGWIGAGTFVSTVTTGGLVDIGYTLSAVPEPSTFALLGIGCIAVLVSRRRRKA